MGCAADPPRSADAADARRSGDADGSSVLDASITVSDHVGGELSIAELRGTPFALVLLPGAFTPVCTSELPLLEHLWEDEGELGIPVVAVSCDSPSALAAWRRAERLRMPFLSDFWPHGALARAVGAFDERTGRARRTSVVCDAEGRIVWRDAGTDDRARDFGLLAEVLRDL